MRAVVDIAVEVGDTIESHALEIKDGVDPTTKPGAAKVAKFVLGAANRLPTDSAERFEGYAYLFLGVTKGAADGIVMFDPKALEDKVRRYFDPDSPPRWDLHWVPVGNLGRGVCVISVAPPTEGDPMQICHSDFQGDDRTLSLEDGRVYYREKASTRVARSGEIKALQRRARSASPPVELHIEAFAGSPRAYSDHEITETIERLLDGRSSAIRAKWRGTDQELETRLSELERSARAEWRSNLPALAGAVHPGLQLAVANLTGAWLEDIELTLYFPEGTLGVDKTDPADLELDQLLPTLFPKPRSNYGGFGSLLPPDTFIPPPSAYPLTWENSGEGLVLTISGIDLRPDSEWRNDDDLVVTVFGHPDEPLKVDWRMTARGHNRSYRGVLEIPVEPASIKNDFQTVVALQRRTDD